MLLQNSFKRYMLHVRLHSSDTEDFHRLGYDARDKRVSKCSRSSLKVAEGRFSETLAPVCQFLRHHIKEHRNPHHIFADWFTTSQCMCCRVSFLFFKTGCPLYRVSEHGSLSTLKVCIRRNVSWQLRCSGTWQMGHLHKGYLQAFGNVHTSMSHSLCGLPQAYQIYGTSGSRWEVPWNFELSYGWRVEKASWEKWRSVTWSQVGEEHPPCYKTREGWLDWSSLA